MAISEEMASALGMFGKAGLPSSKPRFRAAVPANACTARSWAGLSRNGPSWPNADMEQ